MTATIDPVLSLAFSMHSSKGVYALLLGSGISRPAGIPTGWEVMEDLVTKLASLRKVKVTDPMAWFKGEYGRDASYSDLIEDLAKTPTERRNLLKAYFEASREDKEQGIKTPTKAHKAIAKLVSTGYIKVIIQTNFDRLMEFALEEEGVIPTVVSTAAAAEGLIPIVHQQCVIVKVNGDYLDVSVKNTVQELTSYEKSLNELLDRVFDEYGLVVCGWSAVWDHALREALMRATTHRFSTTWASRGEISEEAQRVIQQRRASVISGHDANGFFVELEEKIISLEDLKIQNSLPMVTAIATVKRYLVDGKFRIRLHDLFMSEVEKVKAEFTDELLPVSINFTEHDIEARVKKYEYTIDNLLAMYITASYWGSKENAYLLIKVLETVAHPFGERSGKVDLLNLRKYPALLLLYAGGIAAIASQDYPLLAEILLNAKIRDNSQVFNAALYLQQYGVMDGRIAKILRSEKKEYTSLSNHLFSLLREKFKGLIPLEEVYEEIFDRFEYLLAIVIAESYHTHREGGDYWAPIGRFGWKTLRSDDNMPAIVSREISDNTAKKYIQVLFPNSPESFETVKTAIDNIVDGLNWW